MKSVQFADSLINGGLLIDGGGGGHVYVTCIKIGHDNTCGKSFFSICMSGKLHGMKDISWQRFTLKDCIPSPEG